MANPNLRLRGSGDDRCVKALTSAEIENLDAYQLFAALGKRVVHPGGRKSTEELFAMAAIEPHHHVLEIGCGNGTTAVTIVERFGARVTAVDIDPMMLERARATVAQHRLEDRVTLEQMDVRALGFPDETFDRVVIEAVTMFVEHQAAAREAVRVCKPGGMVLDHEFIWRKPPTPGIRHGFQVEVCPMEFETADMWEGVYRRAGLEDVQITIGTFGLITPQGFLRDEGLANTLMIGAHCLRRWAFIKKTAWNLKRIVPAAPYLGYVVIAGTKPSPNG